MRKTIIGLAAGLAMVASAPLAAGEHQERLSHYLHILPLACVGGAFLLVLVYVFWLRAKNGPTARTESEGR